MSQPTVRAEIRLQLIRASSRLRAAADDLGAAIEALDSGDVYDERLGNALIEAGIAEAQMQQARGMQRVASIGTQEVLR